MKRRIDAFEWTCILAVAVGWVILHEWSLRL